jgi:flagellar hook-associated protein 1 FlgK
MATISAAMHVITAALEADQSSLDIVANNVANANTAGYTREVPNWRENVPVEINGVAYGTGVSQIGPSSVRNRILEQRLVQEQQAASGTTARLAALNSVQTLFAPSSGSTDATAGDIGSDITELFSSFAALEANPTDTSLRTQVLAAARLLAGDVSGAAANLNEQKTSLDEQAASVADQVNSLTASIAKLNIQIQAKFPDEDAGALEDERQMNLSRLSQLIGINQIKTENNGISITTTSGEMLVSEGSSYSLVTGEANGATRFFIGTRDVTTQIEMGGGQLGGLLTARDQDIPSVLNSLDQLAYVLSKQVNALNSSGIDLNGNTSTATHPLYIFSDPATQAGSAARMAVIMSDPSDIAAASTGEGTGDNSNASKLAGLASSPIVGGLTPTGFYSSLVTRLGAGVAEVQIENTAQIASVSQLQTARDALSKVNLNEEAALMQQFERSYQAASQIFAILNSIMGTVINLGIQTAVS